MAGGPRRRRDPGLDRGREPRSPTATWRRSRAREQIKERLTDALGLREVRHPRPRRGAGTSTPTTPGCRTRASCTRRSRSEARQGPARPEHALRGRHRRPRRHGRSPRTASAWPMPWPRPAPTGSRGRSATSRRARTPTTTSAGASSPAPSGRPTARASIYGRFPEPKEGDDLKAANYTRRSTSTRSARRRRRTGSSGRTTSTRTGGPTSPSPTTART